MKFSVAIRLFNSYFFVCLIVHFLCASSYRWGFFESKLGFIYIVIAKGWCLLQYCQTAFFFCVCLSAVLSCIEEDLQVKCCILFMWNLPSAYTVLYSELSRFWSVVEGVWVFISSTRRQYFKRGHTIDLLQTFQYFFLQHKLVFLGGCFILVFFFDYATF